MSIEYERKPGRSLGRLSVAIKPPGKVIVTAHPMIPGFVVQQFIDSKSSWITAQLQKLASHHTTTIPPGTLPIFGQPFRITWTQDQTSPRGISMDAQTLRWNEWRASLQNHSKFEIVLRRFLLAKAKQFLSLRTAYWATKMGVSVARLSYKEQTTRWGSCSSGKTISFNWRLIHQPPAVIDYVVIHELAHLTELNHSTRFWQLVEKFDPAYRVHRGWLKRQGHAWELAWHAIMKP